MGEVLAVVLSVLRWPLDVLGVPSDLGAVLLFVLLLTGLILGFDMLFVDDPVERPYGCGFLWVVLTGVVVLIWVAGLPVLSWVRSLPAGVVTGLHILALVMFYRGLLAAVWGVVYGGVLGGIGAVFGVAKLADWLGQRRKEGR